MLAANWINEYTLGDLIMCPIVYTESDVPLVLVGECLWGHAGGIEDC